MRRAAPRRVGAVVAALLLAVAGCGVRAESEPRQVQPPPGPYRAVPTDSPPPSEAGAVPERLCLVRNDRLVPITRRISEPVGAGRQIEDLLAGPTEEERTAGLGSALAGTSATITVRVVGVEAQVEVGELLDGANRTDEVLAVGQIVCTLSARPDVAGVSFFQNGQRLGIPRADGAVSQGPLTAADYAELIDPE